MMKYKIIDMDKFLTISIDGIFEFKENHMKGYYLANDQTAQQIIDMNLEGITTFKLLPINEKL